MKAAILRAYGAPLAIEEVALTKPGPREVLVRTAAAGVCRSDLAFRDGEYRTPLPTVLGHESAGVVEQIGADVTSIKPGDHVITCISAFCGHCEHCLSGHMALCESGEVKRTPDQPARFAAPHGLNQFLNLSSFAEYMLIHEHACVSIRKDMPLDRAALIGCAVVTGIGAVWNTAQVRPAQSVAVIGCGGVGLAAINGAAIAGAGPIIALDVAPEKEGLARTFGATDFFDARDKDCAKAVSAATKGGVDHAFDCIGEKGAAQLAVRLARRGGAATIVGMLPMRETLEIPAWALMAEKRVQGCLMGSNRFPIDMPRYVDMYMAGKLKLDALVARRIPLAAVNDAFADLERGAPARSVIVFD